MNGTQKGTLYERDPGRQDRVQHAQPARLDAGAAVRGDAAAGFLRARGPGPGRQAAHRRARRRVRRAARASHVEDAWLRAIAHAESGFRADAVSPKGAQGVMQLMPATAKQYRVRRSLLAADSIRGGARAARRPAAPLQGRPPACAAAYNAGVGAVSKYGGVPPYAETQAYVAKVDRCSTVPGRACGPRAAPPRPPRE
jgi:soluble lytic murein transglycosylase-like protein